jgi:hypothetical protein
MCVEDEETKNLIEEVQQSQEVIEPNTLFYDVIKLSLKGNSSKIN